MTIRSTAHTTHPWEDNGNGLIYGQVRGDEEAPFVADVCKDGASGRYSDEEQANARLICAAPLLLEALRAVLPYAHSEAEYLAECLRRDGGPELRVHLQACEAALATARAAVASATEDALGELRAPIVIEVRGGIVEEVRNVPLGVDYEIIDHDAPDAKRATAGRSA